LSWPPTPPPLLVVLVLLPWARAADEEDPVEEDVTKVKVEEKKLLSLYMVGRTKEGKVAWLELGRVELGWEV
jgi:hypothetical protein